MPANDTAKKVAKAPVTKAAKPAPAAKPKSAPAKRAAKAKAVSGKAPVNKVVSKPAVAKPASAKPAAAKPSPAKAVATKPAVAAKAPAPKSPAKPAAKLPVKVAIGKVAAPAKSGKASAKSRKADEDQEQEPIKSPFNAKELAVFKDLLLKLRDRIIDEMNFLARDNLNRSSKDAAGDLSSYSFHMADQGTDNFDREFAASLLSGEQDVLYEIEEALRRVDGGSYGVCEMSGQPIERERLKVLPYARYSVAVQSQMEKGKPRFRPFRRVSIQQAGGTEG